MGPNVVTLTRPCELSDFILNTLNLESDYDCTNYAHSSYNCTNNLLELLIFAIMYYYYAAEVMDVQVEIAN